jgi:hypothetical protein
MRKVLKMEFFVYQTSPRKYEQLAFIPAPEKWVKTILLQRNG